MILSPDVHHPNDITFQYLIEVMPSQFHHRLGLPGKFVKNYPGRIIKRDGGEREMDWLMLVEPYGKTLFEHILINVEFQSLRVDPEKIKTIAEYRNYAKTYYGMPVLTVIVITDEYEYEQSQKEYSRVATDMLKPHYIHMNDKEVTEKLNILEEHIDNLSDDNAIDMVLLPMFASKQIAPEVTEKMAHLFRKNTSIKGMFRNDIAFALSIMIRKYFDLTEKGKELLEMMKPEVENTRMRNVIEYEVDYAVKSFEKEIEEKDKTISEKNKEISKMGEELSKRDEELSKRDEKIKQMEQLLEDNNIDC